MFKMILNVSVVRMWRHTAPRAVWNNNTALSGFWATLVETPIKIQFYVTIFIFQLPKPNNLHQLWILLIVECIFNAPLCWIIHWKSDREKLFLSKVSWMEHLKNPFVMKFSHPLRLKLYRAKGVGLLAEHPVAMAYTCDKTYTVGQYVTLMWHRLVL